MKIPRSGSARFMIVSALLLAVGLAGAKAFAGGDDGDGRPGFAGRRIEKILDRVGATPEQRTSVKAIWDGLRPQLRGLHQQTASVRKQMLAALAAPTIDTAAVERLRQQMMGFAEKKSALMTQGIVRTAQVLTPDQRKQAQEAFAKHRRHGHGFGGDASP
jgi:periplasmic protein CpxP/Spy